MAIYWVDDAKNQAIAIVPESMEGQPPDNLIEVNAPDRSEEPKSLYFDGTELKLIPPYPDSDSGDSSSNYYWDFEELKWAEEMPHEASVVNVPDWKTFRDAMLFDEDYDDASDQMMVASAKNLMRLENALTTEPQDVDLIIHLWNGLISKIAIKPDSGAIAAWNQYAINNRIPLEFKSGGSVSKRGT